MKKHNLKRFIEHERAINLIKKLPNSVFLYTFATEIKKSTMAINNKRGAEKFVQCLTCKNATAYYQWFENPVIAQCGATDERQVAQTKRICKSYIERFGEPEIQHFDHYEGEGSE